MPWRCDEAVARRESVETHRAFSGSSQVALLGLEGATDVEIWQYAKDNRLVIVSRDSDFQERSLIDGHPPQVVWLNIPNRSKTVVLNILLDHCKEIEHALAAENLACVEIQAGK